MSAEPTKPQLTAYFQLRRRRQKFVDAYVESGIGTDAMRAIGFKGKRPDLAASKLLQIPEVRAALEERKQEAIEKAGISAVQVLMRIKDVGDRCRQRVRPLLDRKGAHVLIETEDGLLAPAYVFDAKSALRSDELLGNYLKLFTTKLEHTGKNGAPIAVAATSVTPEQLAEAVRSVRDTF